MIWKRKSSPSSNSHWPMLMAKLKSSALTLASQSEAKGRAAPSLAELQRAHLSEIFLSEIDDALELSRNLVEDDRSFCKVNINQIAADLGESFTQRYGADFISDFSLLVDHNLPIAQTHPYALMRILDCLIRGSERVRSKRLFSVSMKLLNKSNKAHSSFRVDICCDNLSLPSDFERVTAAMHKFKRGVYLNLIHDIGLDFCAAFHLVRQLGGRIRIEPTERHLVNLKIEIELLTASEQFPATAPPSRFYVIGENASLVESLKSLAMFHKSEAILSNDPSQLKGSEWLVYDASCSPTGKALEFIKQLPNPKKTILLVSPGSRAWQKELFSCGFCNFVTLPLISPKLLRALNGMDSRTQPRRKDRATPPKHGLSVLIVDDTATARIVLRDYFDEHGFSVTEASDGAEFTDLMKKGRRFDLIFCDVTMCHMDGITAIKVLRDLEEGTNGHTPVVLMTAYSAPDIAERAAGAEIDCFMEKPIEQDKLDQVVRQLVTPLPKPEQLEETEIIVLENLRQRCAGRTGTMVRVLDSFISMSQEYLLRMKSRDLQGNHPELRKALHTIKGLLREISAQEAANVVEILEDKLRSKSRLTEQELEQLNQILNSAKRNAESVKQHLTVQ